MAETHDELTHRVTPLGGGSREAIGVAATWDLTPAELNQEARAALLWLVSGDPEAAELAPRLEWSARALAELEYLQPMPKPDEGRYFSVTYMYFEGLAALREATAAALSGLYHSSFAVLRSALEMFVYHYWWRRRLEARNTYEEFFKWLHGEVKVPWMSDVLEQTYDGLDLPSAALGLTQVQSLYRRLCRYAHKPLVHETVTAMKIGGQQSQDRTLLAYCLLHVAEASRSVLDLSIAVMPRCLFPVDLIRKFGVNSPTGTLLDEHSFHPIAVALGSDLDQYQRHYAGDANVTEFLQWYHDAPDIDLSALAQSWLASCPPPASLEELREGLLPAFAEATARLRVQQRLNAYLLVDLDVRQIDELTAQGGEDGKGQPTEH